LRGGWLEIGRRILRAIGANRVFDSGGRLDPAIVVGEATVGSDCLDDSLGGDFARAAFEDAVEHVAAVFAASFDEAEGSGVAVDGAAVSNVVLFGEVVDVAPVDEFFLDLFAVGMVAYEAFALVAFFCGKHG